MQFTSENGRLTLRFPDWESRDVHELTEFMSNRVFREKTIGNVRIFVQLHMKINLIK